MVKPCYDDRVTRLFFGRIVEPLNYRFIKLTINKKYDWQYQKDSRRQRFWIYHFR